MTGPEAVRLTIDAEELDGDALLARYPAGNGPWLRANVVTSVDGAVEVAGRSGGLSGRTDRRLLRLLRTRCDAVLVGAGTVRAEGYAPPLVDEHHQARRRAEGRPAQPTLVVVSGSLALDPAHPALAAAAAADREAVRPIVLTTAGAPADRRAALAAGADVLTAAGADGIDLAAGVRLLRERGLRQILCEGGPQLLGSLIAADLVDEVCVTVSSVLAGAGAGRIVAGPASPLRQLSLHHVLVADDAIFLRYRRAT